MTEFACECLRVSAGYGAGPAVLHDLDCRIAAGERVALLGPNGAGKSTLLRVVTGLHPPASGQVRLFGTDVRRLPAVARSRVLAVVPQTLTTPMAYTVEELALMGRAALLRPWQAPGPGDRQVIERALAYTDLSDLRDRPLEALSGGEKQRAVLAMALAQEPRLIVMDEPTTHLDLNHSLELMQLIERLNREQGVTVLMTSHDLNLAAEYCTRLILLDHGRLCADGAPADVLREETLREVYHCEIRVRTDPQTGSVLVTPARRLVEPRPGRALRVHVIAGGGSGGDLMRRLVLAGHRLSCGVLNRQDTDAVTAAALGAELALEKPFAPIGPIALARGVELAADAAVVVLCEVPFGPGNLVNLELAEQALRRGTPVLVNDRRLAERDYSPGGQASARIARLLEQGAASWRHVGEALDALARRSL